jgi:cell shape-determining protein MreD
MKDERVEQAINKIRSEMAIIIFSFVLISFLVKTAVFRMNLPETTTEFLILIFSPLYQFIRMQMMKISIYNEPSSKQSIKQLFMIIALLVFVSVVFIIKAVKKSAVYDWQSSGISMVIYIILFAALTLLVNKFNRYRAHKYEKEFDDEK